MTAILFLKITYLCLFTYNRIAYTPYEHRTKSSLMYPFGVIAGAKVCTFIFYSLFFLSVVLVSGVTLGM